MLVLSVLNQKPDHLFKSMEITKEDLQKKYRNLSDDKIIEIYQSGELTDIALSVLKDELSRREITADKIESIEKEKQKEKESQFEKATLPKAPKVWIGFIFALGFLISEFVEIMMGIESPFGPFTTPISLAGMIYWLFCVQRFHQILNALTIDGYSISPGKSVGFHFIPIFNCYWIFKWPYELSKYINSLGKVKMISGVLLGIMFFFSLLFNRVDASIGLACFFGVSAYINRKLKKQLEYGKII
jgi:hypothetical protein